MNTPLPRKLPLMSTPLAKMSAMLAVLALCCVALDWLPAFRALHGMKLAPTWVPLAMEMFAVVVSLMLFGVVWNAQNAERTGNIIIFGSASLAIGLIDAGRLFSHGGMPDFVTPASPLKSINFWLAARLLCAFALLTVSLRKPGPLTAPRTRYYFLAGAMAFTALVYWQVLFHPQWLPLTYVEGASLTSFKVSMEWLIMGIMLLAAVFFWRRARREGSYATATYFGIAMVGALGEYCFTAYTSLVDIYSLLGHSLIVAFDLLLFNTAFLACVHQPFEALRVEVGERRRVEEELRLLNQSLEERVARRTEQLQLANKELESFSYSVSHDLRAPLRAVDGFAQLLGKTHSAMLGEKGLDYIGRIQRASRRMGELIDDILQLSHVSRQEIVRSRVDISRMAQDIALALCQAAPERQVEFSIAEGIEAQVDSKLMRIVLENLIGNAWKFTGRRAQARIEVGVIVTAEGERAIYVRDNGAGFNMDYAHKLYSAFQRLHTDADFEGTGIGLATVQRIVAKHGGRAWAEGQEDVGATFYLSCGKQVAHIEGAQ